MDRPGGGLDAVCVHPGHHHAGANVDTECGQLPAGARRQRLGIGGEDAVGGLEQDDPGGRRVDGAELPGHRAERDLGDRSGHLDAGRSAADHDEGQVGFAFTGIGRTLGSFEREEDPSADLQCVLDGLEAGSVRLPVVVTEVGVRGAGGEHEMIEADHRAVVERHVRLARIDVRHFAEEHADIGLIGQHRPDRCRDVGRIQTRRRHLVEQRLEEVVVAAVDQRDPNRRIGEPSRRRQPAETSADDHHVVVTSGV